jgi:hypothetical protein
MIAHVLIKEVLKCHPALGYLISLHVDCLHQLLDQFTRLMTQKINVFLMYCLSVDPLVASYSQIFG